ncbi:MAG: hypothetical protein AAGA54_08220 [Myxococcota bacterium]
MGCDGGSEVEETEGEGSTTEMNPIAEGLLELGAFGEARLFVPYVGGEEELVEMGLQGGFHIFVDGRLRPDDAPDELIVELVMTFADDGTEVTRIRHQREPDIPDADGWPTLPEMIVFIPDPASVYDRVVDIDVRAETIDGTLLDTTQTQLLLLDGE